MAKDNNLKDFLIDVADAIREKKGTTDLINPQDFSAEIASIETGGGAVVASAVVAPKEVNLRDYDGKVLYAYTKEQFLKLSALPELPTAKGLICEGWNWTLESAKTYVEKYGMLEIGANYITDDGKTRLYITISSDGSMDVPLYFYQSVANGVTINWGDGSAEETINATDKVRITHTYARVGSYCITLDPADNCKWYPGGQSSSDCIMGSTTLSASSSRAYVNMLRRVELGRNLNGLMTYCFQYCSSLESVSMPKYITSVNAYCFQYCYSLKSLVVAGSGIGRYTFQDCYSLESVAIGEGTATTIDLKAFSGCYALNVVTIPPSITTLGSEAFYNCYSLVTIVIPDSITQISQNTFYNCSCLNSVKFPKLTRIDQQVFYTCYSLSYVDMTKQTSVPTLSSATAFSTTSYNCRIIVPYQLYNEWCSASNWSTLTDKLVRNLTATECVSLNITADDVYCGNLDETAITWTAVVNGVLLDGSRVEGVTISGKDKVYIGKNNTTESVVKSVTYEYLGVIANTDITQGAYLNNVVVCKYVPATTTSTTAIISSSFSNFSTYFDTTMVVDGEEVASAASYKFATLDEHIVIFKVKDGAEITSLYRLFYNTVVYMTYADLSALDMSNVTSTSTSAGTAYMFYGCTRLETIKLPSSVKYLGYYMFYNCPKVTSLTIEAMTAPSVYGMDTWGYSSSYLGYTNRQKGINKFYVPTGATGYTDAKYSYLYNTTYCGFTLTYIDE